MKSFLLLTSLITIISLQGASGFVTVLGIKRKICVSNTSATKRRGIIDDNDSQPATPELSFMSPIAGTPVTSPERGPNNPRVFNEGSIIAAGIKSNIFNIPPLPQNPPSAINPSRSGTPSVGTSSFLCAELNGLEVDQKEEKQPEAASMNNNNKSDGTSKIDGRTATFEKMLKNSNHRRSQSQ